METAGAHSYGDVGDFEALGVIAGEYRAGVVGAWEEEGEDGGCH